MKNYISDITRRKFIVELTKLVGAGVVVGTSTSLLFASSSKPSERELFTEALQTVAPSYGYNTSVQFGDSIVKLVEGGAISPIKFHELYARRGGVPEWMKYLFVNASDAPIIFTDGTAAYLLNLLWAVGLATKTKFNENSPILGKDLMNFASTGGWQLGQKSNGGSYFNQIEAVKLNDEQEEVVYQIAKNVYRPCCDNSAFFQDCNHGSAMLGLLELAASQGMNRKDIQRVGLAANSYWYSEKYAKTAIYFERDKGVPWYKVDPETILGRRYSSIGGWRSNIDSKTNIPARGQGGCGA